MTQNRFLTILLAAAVAILVNACGSDDDDAASPMFDFSAFEAEIEAFIDETEAVDGVGAILVHRDEGVIFHRSFGDFDLDRVSLIASASKSVTAGVLMSLADQGLLDIDEPIVDQVAWESDNTTITPAQLLSNSSGLVGLGPNPSFGPYLCQYLSRGTLQDCAEQIFTTTADDENDDPRLAVIPPDTQFRYGGGQWQVAGGVAEIITGKSWAQLVDETYVEPCGMENFGYGNHFTDIPLNDAGYPGGFDGDPANLNPTDNPNLEGGMYSTTADYGKFLLMMLRGGRCDGNQVLSEEATLRVRADRIGPAYGGNTGNGLGGYGLGWWIVDDQIANDPGAYGAVPWIDDSRNYAGYLVIEATSGHGIQLYSRTVDLVAEEIDRHF